MVLTGSRASKASARAPVLPFVTTPTSVSANRTIQDLAPCPFSNAPTFRSLTPSHKTRVNGSKSGHASLSSSITAQRLVHSPKIVSFSHTWHPLSPNVEIPIYCPSLVWLKRNPTWRIAQAKNQFLFALRPSLKFWPLDLRQYPFAGSERAWGRGSSEVKCTLTSTSELLTTLRLC